MVLPEGQAYQMVGVDASVLNRKEQQDFNKHIMDLSKMIDELDMFLAGERIFKDSHSGEWVKEKTSQTPMMNTKGREFVRARLQTYLNPNLYMAELDNSEVEKNFRMDYLNFACDIYGEILNFETTLDDVEKVCHKVAPILYFALVKAKTDKGSIFEKGAGLIKNFAPSLNPFNQNPLQGQGGYHS